MNYKDVLNRFNGFSTPIGGLQWVPPISEKSVAKDILTYLEDRRVLYAPADRDVEVVLACMKSCEDIREEVTNALKKVEFQKEIAKQLRGLRSACRDFCGIVGDPQFGREPKPVQDSILTSALTRLRAKAGLVVAVLSVSYELDVEDELASIIPFEPVW